MTVTVGVSSIDGRIWNPGAVAVQIVDALHRYNHVSIDLLKEAPDITTTELDLIFDSVLRLGFTKDQIDLHTGNMVENYSKVNVVKHPEWMFELDAVRKIAHRIPKEKQIKQHFGCLVSRSNATRLIAAGHLYAQYKDKTFLTYHYCSNNDYHREHVGIQDIMYYFSTNSTEFHEAINLLENSPILKDTVKQYPILLPENFVEPCQWYKNFFVDIVCETFCSGNTFFVTEKFWRAVATKTPFIVHGPQFLLKRLRQIGFKTFSNWWDEGYDEDPHLYSYKEINKTLKQLSMLTIPQIESMYADMQPVLEHNYQRMMSLTYKDFDNVV
jgi:hypothetical protein